MLNLFCHAELVEAFLKVITLPVRCFDKLSRQVQDDNLLSLQLNHLPDFRQSKV